MDINSGLPFESPMEEIERRLRKLEQAATSDSTAIQDEIRALRRQWVDVTRQIYGNLTAWQTVQVARHKNRPQTRDYVAMLCDEFVELHGDKHFGDDQAVVTGFAKLDQYKVVVVGHQKGRNLKERSACYFGCAHPEGYRKALAKMKLAAKYRLPVICLIDTPGAYPGIGAEERGQAWVIAQNMYEMSRLETPIICIVVGEGGSGGALGIGVGDRVAMLEHSYYSVISPEGCAGILWKSHEYAERAAEALRFTSKHLARFGVVDTVIEEPLGGAHRDPHQTATRIKIYLTKTLRELAARPGAELVAGRYEKFRRMGIFLEQAGGPAGNGQPATAASPSASPSSGG